MADRVTQPGGPPMDALPLNAAPQTPVLTGLIFLVVCLLGGVIAWSSRIPNSDLFMTLAGGRDVVEGRVGDIDDWSYLTRGDSTASAPAASAASSPSTDADADAAPRVWINQSWLTGWALYHLWQRYDGSGMVAARTVALALFALGMIAWLRAQRVSWAAAFAVTATVLATCRYFFLLRGNLATLVCVPWLLFFLSRLRTGSIHWSWPIAALLAVWAHAHGGWIFGGAVIGLWIAARLPEFIVSLSKGGPVGPVARRIIAMLLTIVAGLVSAGLGPFGFKSISTALSMGGQTRWREIRDWHPIILSKDYFLDPRATGGLDGWPLFWTDLARTFQQIGLFLCMLAIAVIILGAATLRAWRMRDAAPRTRGIGAAVFDLGLVGVTLWMAFTSRRFVPLASIALTLPLAEAVDALWTARRPPTQIPSGAPPRVRGAALWIGLAAVAVLAAFAYPTTILGFSDRHPFLPPQSTFDRQVVTTRLPVAAAAFMRLNRVTGNVQHPYSYEGYLRWSVPDIRVGCGGRAQQIYTEKEFERVTSFDDSSAAFLVNDAMAGRLRMLDRYDIHSMLMPVDYWPLIMRFIESGRWIAVYFDGDDALLVRTDDPAWLDRLKSLSIGAGLQIGDAPPAERDAGAIVYPTESIALRSRALFLASPAIRIDESSPRARADHFAKRASAIDMAQAARPLPHLYVLMDAVSREPGLDPAAVTPYFIAELDRLESPPVRDAMSGALVEQWYRCRMTLAAILERRFAATDNRMDAVRMADLQYACRQTLERLARWWMM